MLENFETLSAHQKAVRTKDVATALIEISHEWKCAFHEIDFDILEVSTFQGDTEIDFIPNQLDYMVDGEQVFNIFQIYNIVVYKKASSLEKDIKIALASNSNITQVYAAIKAKTAISSFQYSKDSFRELIHKKMIVNKLLVGTWSISLEESIDKIFAVVNKKQELVLLKDLKFPISRGKNYVPDIPESLIRHFEKKSLDESSVKRVDHASRDYIKSVKKGELLIEYYFYQKGRYGRNCRGESFGKRIKEPGEMTVPIADEATIEIVPHKHGINYYAKNSGYINIDDPIVTVKESLEIAQVSFRSTGNIEGKVGENINVTIGRDPLSINDAVGMGVTVEADTIHVKGNTGSNSLLRGKNVIIEGKTHPKSTIYTEKADINIHCGTLVAKSATVAFLEMGEIRAEKVHINDLFTGSVLAKEAVILKLHSNSTISASHMIRIDVITGGENHIKIDNHKHKKRVEELGLKILNEEQNINRLRSSYDAIVKSKERQRESIKETVAMLRDYKKRKRQAPAALLDKVKAFKDMDTQLNQINREIKERHSTSELLNGSLTSLERTLLESRIIIGKIEENGHNMIEFHLHASNKTFKQPAQPFTAYTVAKSQEGTYEVKVESYVDRI